MATDTVTDASIERQLGGVLARLDNIQEMMKERAIHTDKQHEQTQNEIRNIKHDQRGIETRLDLVIYPKIERLDERLTDLEEPVKDLMKLRTRVGGVMLVLGALVTTAWISFETIGRWALDRFFGGK